MEDLVSGSLRIIVEQEGADVYLRWRGKSNDRQPYRTLEPFFQRVLDHVDGKGCTVQMRFDELEHFNSSTISALIQLIHVAKERGVPLVFTYDEKLRWQKISFDALRIFAKDPAHQLELRPV